MKERIRQNLNNTVDTGFIPELGKHKPGKVRDIHFTSDNIGDPIIMVASDRVSAFDYILNKRVPFKGRVLNLFNKWAFENTKDIVPNALMPSPHENVIIQKNLKNIMIECVVRGYVWGSLASDYEKGKRQLCGIKLPEGLIRYQKLDEPLFTPTTKSDEHDEPMTFAEVEEKLGKNLAKKVKDVSLQLYKRGEELARKAGYIFIDTKYEFGLDEQGELYLIDEANTPDSSRYCEVSEYEKYDKIKKEMDTGKYKNVSELLKEKPELKIREMSKQFVRDVLTEKGFSYGSEGEVPRLEDEDVVEVSHRYISLYEQLTGNKFSFPGTSVQQDLIEKLRMAGYIKGGMAIIMAGSDSDMEHVKKLQKELSKYSIPSRARVCSAHKQPSRCEQIVKEYNNSLEPLAIIAVAGGTDALSGVASFHSLHPVVSCPPDPEKYHSCLFNPPGSSNSLILKPKNVARHCAQLLAISEAKQYLLNKNQEKVIKLEEADNGL